MTEIEVQVALWGLGGLGTLALLIFTFWWRKENTQDEKIECVDQSVQALMNENERAHGRIHHRIGDVKDELKDQMNGHHNALRDKIEVLILEIRNGGH